MARGNTMRGARMLLRFFNFAFSVVALATLSRAFVGSSYYGYSSMLGSRAATYATLMTYTGMLVGLFFLLFMEGMRMLPRPTRLFEQLVDLLLAALLVVAGIVLVVSDYVANCSDLYDSGVSCWASSWVWSELVDRILALRCLRRPVLIRRVATQVTPSDE
ncbi:hypothetical protein CCR75_009564 [Bremia lactucae]|uniref:MARVEL domain-containing protein n=1 Tax=Bremia lactucae TaxID=4779 RepID=A0A976ILR5_BRELC|nr:hypothetical protein CCR75_009564 [Bremia lactucae]